MNNHIIIIILSIVAGGLYRLGGTNKGTLWRDLGVPIVATIVLVILGVKIWWALLLHFGLLYGSLTTYHKWVGKLFGRKDKEVHIESWAMTGFCYGFALLPVALALDNWTFFLLRSAILSLAVALWSEFIDEVNSEESGRGILIICSLLWI